MRAVAVIIRLAYPYFRSRPSMVTATPNPYHNLTKKRTVPLSTASRRVTLYQPRDSTVPTVDAPRQIAINSRASLIFSLSAEHVKASPHVSSPQSHPDFHSLFR